MRSQRQKSQPKSSPQLGLIPYKHYLYINQPGSNQVLKIHYSQPFSIITANQGNQIQVLTQTTFDNLGNFGNEVVYQSDPLTPYQIDSIIQAINFRLQEYQTDLVKMLSFSENQGYNFKIIYLLTNPGVAKFVAIGQNCNVKFNSSQQILSLGSKDLKMKNIKSFDVRSYYDVVYDKEVYRFKMFIEMLGHMMHQQLKFNSAALIFIKAKVRFLQFKQNINQQQDGLSGYFKKLYLDFCQKKVSYELLRESQSNFLKELQSQKKAQKSKRLAIDDGFKNVGNSFHSQKSQASNNRCQNEQKSQKRKISMPKDIKIKYEQIRLQAQNKENIQLKNQRKGSDSRKNQEQIYQKIAKKLIKKNSRNKIDSSSQVTSQKECRDLSYNDRTNTKSHILPVRSCSKGKSPKQYKNNQDTSLRKENKLQVDSKCQTQRQLQLQQRSQTKQRQFKRKPLQEIQVNGQKEVKAFDVSNSTPRFSKNNRLQNYLRENDFSSPLDQAPSKNKHSSNGKIVRDFTLNDTKEIEVEFQEDQLRIDENFDSQDYRSPFQDKVKAPSDFLVKMQQDTEPSFANKFEISADHLVSKQRSFEDKMTEKQITKSGDNRQKYQKNEYGLRYNYSQKSLREFQEKLNKNFKPINEDSSFQDESLAQKSGFYTNSQDYQLNLMNDMKFIKKELVDTKALLNSTLAQLSRIQRDNGQVQFNMNKAYLNNQDESNKENVLLFPGRQQNGKQDSSNSLCQFQDDESITLRIPQFQQEESFDNKENLYPMIQEQDYAYQPLEQNKLQKQRIVSHSQNKIAPKLKSSIIRAKDSQQYLVDQKQSQAMNLLNALQLQKLSNNKNTEMMLDYSNYQKVQQQNSNQRQKQIPHTSASQAPIVNRGGQQSIGRRRPGVQEKYKQLELKSVFEQFISQKLV
eukprot:403333685